jgi:hypothetical protein
MDLMDRKRLHPGFDRHQERPRAFAFRRRQRLQPVSAAGLDAAAISPLLFALPSFESSMPA